MIRQPTRSPNRLSAAGKSRKSQTVFMRYVWRLNLVLGSSESSSKLFLQTVPKRSDRARTGARKSGTVLAHSTKRRILIFRAVFRVILDFLTDYGSGLGAVALVLPLPSIL